MGYNPIVWGVFGYIRRKWERLMAQPYLTAANCYRFVTISSEASDVTDKWSTVWTVRDNNPTSSSTLFQGIADQLAAFMQDITYDGSKILQTEVYPYSVGVAPGGPVSPLYVFTHGLTGDNNGAHPGVWSNNGDPCAGSVAGLLRLTRRSGPRNGKKFIRAMFKMGDVTVSGFHDPWSNARTNIPSTVNTSAHSFLGDFMAGDTSFDPAALELIIMHSHRDPTTGYITTLTPGGINSITFERLTTIQMSRHGSNIG